MEAKTKEKTIKLPTDNNDDENILSLYLKEINRIPLLSREEENYYARKAAEKTSFSLWEA